MNDITYYVYSNHTNVRHVLRYRPMFTTRFVYFMGTTTNDLTKQSSKQARKVETILNTQVVYLVAWQRDTTGYYNFTNLTFLLYPCVWISRWQGGPVVVSAPVGFI